MWRSSCEPVGPAAAPYVHVTEMPSWSAIRRIHWASPAGAIPALSTGDQTAGPRAPTYGLMRTSNGAFLALSLPKSGTSVSAFTRFCLSVTSAVRIVSRSTQLHTNTNTHTHLMLNHRIPVKQQMGILDISSIISAGYLYFKMLPKKHINKPKEIRHDWMYLRDSFIKW